MSTPYKFDLPAHHKSIIKVIGVGGGGSNAVNHMYNQGIKDVEFVICNTDIQALKSSPVPHKLQIGVGLTQGLGCGANPETGRNAALESKEEIREFFSDGTKMVFITAGMGGGTGTGAAPVIAKIARDLDILTVGIVTLPFNFEGRKKIQAAKNGIAELKQFCDTVLVIVNDKLFDINDNLTMRQAFEMADNVLTTGAKSIAEIITVSSHVNVDFEDVKTVMKNSGAAVMGSAVSNGDNRALVAAEKAIYSSLLDNTDILGAKKILLSMVSGSDVELTVKELNQITSYIQEKAGDEAEVIWGEGIEAELGDSIRVTIIATGFDHTYDNDLPAQKKVYDLEKDQTAAVPVQQTSKPESREFYVYERKELEAPAPKPAEQQVYNLDGPSHNTPRQENQTTRIENQYSSPAVQPENRVEPQYYRNAEQNEQKQLAQYNQNQIKPDSDPTSQGQFDFVNDTEEKKRILYDQSMDRIKRLKNLNTPMDVNPDDFKNKLEVPAYLRRKVDLPEHPHSSEKKISRFNLNDDNELLGNNKFLHDNVD
jgi:cell division protein FtsZ